MRIRPLRADDVEPLVDELFRPFAREMAALDDYNALAEEVREPAIAYRRETLEDENRRTLVAEADDGLAGYVEAEVKTPPPVFARGDECYVHGLYVRLEHRGEGLGDDLLATIEAWADERGCEYVGLDVERRERRSAGALRVPRIRDAAPQAPPGAVVGRPHVGTVVGRPHAGTVVSRGGRPRCARSTGA
jgi:GNAT superfamily N-acetyltransferase